MTPQNIINVLNDVRPLFANKYKLLNPLLRELYTEIKNKQLILLLTVCKIPHFNTCYYIYEVSIDDEKFKIFSAVSDLNPIQVFLNPIIVAQDHNKVYDKDFLLNKILTRRLLRLYERKETYV